MAGYKLVPVCISVNFIALSPSFVKTKVSSLYTLFTVRHYTIHTETCNSLPPAFCRNLNHSVDRDSRQFYLIFPCRTFQ
jgi:hypothetical protein